MNNYVCLYSTALASFAWSTAALVSTTWPQITPPSFPINKLSAPRMLSGRLASSATSFYSSFLCRLPLAHVTHFWTRKTMKYRRLTRRKKENLQRSWLRNLYPSLNSIVWFSADHSSWLSAFWAVHITRRYCMGVKIWSRTLWLQLWSMLSSWWVAYRWLLALIALICLQFVLERVNVLCLQCEISTTGKTSARSW